MDITSTSTSMLVKIHTGHLLTRTLAHESSVMCANNPHKQINSDDQNITCIYTVHQFKTNTSGGSWMLT